MDGHTITIILSDEANSFVRQQPFKAQQKIAYNIRRVQSGLIEKDVFKKLENSDIWELRTLFNGICYRLFAFWDTKKGALVGQNIRYNKYNWKWLV
ncbi:MAG: addiction module toxin RelE [Bacteroidales bacterium 43_8]|nr:MAG: addiction module toxin RelE [Bacteroidales bacterium 43_8]